MEIDHNHDHSAVEMENQNNLARIPTRTFLLRKLRVIFIATCVVLLIRRNVDSRRALSTLDLVGDDVMIGAQGYKVTTFFGGSASRQVTYSMQRYDSYNLTFAAPAYKCHIGNSTNKKGVSKWRDPLLESLQSQLNFTTFVDSNLRVLVVGDSVAIQMGQLLEEALGATPSSRQVIHESWPGHDGLTISATKGGGAIAHLRLTGMLLAKGEGMPIPNYGRGWNRTHVQQLMQHRNLINGNNIHDPSFDVMIFRISHGWLKFQDITEERVRETINMAKELFGVKKIILVNVPFNNNIRRRQGLKDWEQANNMIDRVASTYPITLNGNSTGEDDLQVTVLQFAHWTNMLMHHNAEAIGWNTSDGIGNLNESYPLGRLGCKQHPESIAQGCSEKVNEGDCECRRNRISQDGIHWCLESLGGRLTAGLACLMACFQDPGEDSQLDGSALHSCETQCNNQFMSMQPLDI